MSCNARYWLKTAARHVSIKNCRSDCNTQSMFEEKILKTAIRQNPLSLTGEIYFREFLKKLFILKRHRRRGNSELATLNDETSCKVYPK
jgi:hypothetical protein